jgi:anti-sigma B factor antagonist
MKVHKREEGSTLVVAFEGDVDLQTSPEARKVLLEAVGHGGTVVVDLSGVNYIDSSGIASLVEALQRARQLGGALSLAAVSEAALRVLRLARLDRVFKVFPDVATALEDGAQT